MKLIYTLLILALVAASCSSSKTENTQPDEYANLTKLDPPQTQQYNASKVYIDSVKMIDHNNKKALLIAGNVSNGCTKLHKAEHILQNDSLSVTLTGWEPAGKMCTQALVPFTFIYEQPAEEELKQAAAILVNQKAYKIQQ